MPAVISANNLADDRRSSMDGLGFSCKAAQKL